MSDDPSITSLPYELLWTIVDALLDGIGSVFNAGRLGLACSTTLALLADNGAWRTRCRRHFGRARAGVHAHAERFGVRWIYIYVAMANEVTSLDRASMRDADPARRLWGTFSRPGLCYWGQIAGGRPCAYGVYVTRDPDVGSDAVVIAEASLDVGHRSGWISARRAVFPDVTPPYPSDHRADEAYCICRTCVWQCPRLTSRLGHVIVAYEGDWDAARLHGRGRATLLGGLVYDGQWADGVPHGQGALNGKLYRWHRGLCVGFGRWTGPERELTGDGDWSYEGDVVLGTSGADDDDLRLWCKMTSVLEDRLIGGPHGTPTRSHGPVPHGHGRATHPDGRVYVGTWRVGRRERGRCTLPSGAVLDGIWYVTPDTDRCRGTGWVTGPCYRFHAAAAWGRYDEWHCDATRPERTGEHVTLLVGRRGRGMSAAFGSGLVNQGNGAQWHSLAIAYDNGDRCVVVSNSTERFSGIARFICSTYCPDSDFAGLAIICETGWSPIPFHPEQSVAAVYWPNDPASDAFARFVAYVRKGYIGWTPAQVDAFWAAVVDLGVVAPTMHAESEPQS
ncbi:morn repeat incomplete domain containing protein [Pandoravirus celtis]|uniref:Morn repeat incomplete domain containing protein n=1 Tax=Pandoravirus celtis TaxID=2568002 RepID=A0A4D6EHI8_9VIRU|nr:morn repeat incomplete domain containing protein [Pandoravirus celtis]